MPSKMWTTAVHMGADLHSGQVNPGMSLVNDVNAVTKLARMVKAPPANVRVFLREGDIMCDNLTEDIQREVKRRQCVDNA